MDQITIPNKKFLKNGMPVMRPKSSLSTNLNNHFQDLRSILLPAKLKEKKEILNQAERFLDSENNV